MEVLEYHSHFLAHLMELFVAHLRKVIAFKDHGAFGRLFEHIEAAEKSAFSGAGRPYHNDLFALFYRGIDAFEYL